MRRPLKPFVTEYKASNRRHKEAGEASPAFLTDVQGTRADAGKRAAAAFDFKSFEAAPPEARHRTPPSSPRDLRFSASGSEDGYEAALRAADALFAPSTNTARRSQPEHDAGEPPLSSQAFSEPVNGEPFSNGKAPPSGHGRILPSLEEPLAPIFADREADLPKRRGRKPGSKNKPKTVAIDDFEDTRVPGAIVGQDAWQPQYAMSETQSDADRLFEPAARGRPFSRIPSSMRPLPPLPANRAMTASRERFAWVRRQLAPGERWKRRLPKVVW